MKFGTMKFAQQSSLHAIPLAMNVCCMYMMIKTIYFNAKFSPIFISLSVNCSHGCFIVLFVYSTSIHSFIHIIVANMLIGKIWPDFLFLSICLLYHLFIMNLCTYSYVCIILLYLNRQQSTIKEPRAPAKYQNQIKILIGFRNFACTFF